MARALLAWVSSPGRRGRGGALWQLALHQQAGIQRGVAECLLGFAALHAHAGAARKAVTLATHGLARLEALGARIWPADRADLERALAPARAALGPDAVREAEAAGRALSPAEALALARRATPAPDATAHA